MILFLWKKAKKACNRETVARQRERKRRKRRFCDQCCRVDVKVKSTEQYEESFSEESQRILFWWSRSPRKPWTKSSTSYCWWKFSSGKIMLDWVRHWDPKFGSKKFRISIIRVLARAWISKTAVIGNIFNGQIKLSVREHICVANCRWRVVFTRIATQDVANNLKNWNMLLSRVKYWKRWRLEEFPVQHDQESRTMSLVRDQVRSVPEILVFGEDSKIFYDRDSSSSYDNTTFFIKLLLHRVQESSIPKLECCEIHEKICVFVETFLIVNVLDEILMNYTMIQELWQQ